MGRCPSHPRLVQGDLFASPQKAPAWEQLAAKVREQTGKLLALVLCEHYEGHRDAATGKEAHDE